MTKFPEELREAVRFWEHESMVAREDVILDAARRLLRLIDGIGPGEYGPYKSERERGHKEGHNALREKVLQLIGAKE